MDKQTAHKRASSNLSSQVFITARSHADLYEKGNGNYHVWLARREAADPRFPRPVFIGHRKFYSVAEVEEYQRSLLAERA